MIRKQCLHCRSIFAEDKTLCDQCSAPLAAIIIDSLDGCELKGKYLIERELGRGGMGTVYSALQQGLERKVALKMLLHDVRHDELALKRFEAEARAMSALSHPNIVKIFDFDVSELGLPFIVMEHIEGRSLSDELKRHGRLDFASAARMLMQICDALEHAHRRQVIHRDLKPGNIMIVDTEDGSIRPIVLDFGIAKIFAQAGRNASRLTQTGEVFGSPLYMSPEQCMGQPLDNRSDIYSFGCLMYELLTGRAPYMGDGFLETVFLHINQDVPGLGRVSADDRVQEALEELFSRMMAKKSGERFASMLELRRRIEEIAAMAAASGADSQSTGAWPITDVPEEEIISIWREAAERGDAAAQFDLGISYRFGEGIGKDESLAAYWLLKSARQGYVEAQHCLAIMLNEGAGIEKNEREAVDWWLKAAEQNHVQSQYELGVQFHNGTGVDRDMDKACYWYLKAAENGSSYAQVAIGECCLWGEGREQNYDEATRWFQLAADQGYEWGMLRLGEMYEKGRGVDLNHEEACRLYKLAADTGLGAAFHRLGLMHRDGLGVKKDLSEAKRLLTVAAEDEYEYAQYDLAMVLESVAVNLADYQQALGWFEKAAEREVADAQTRYFALKKLIREKFRS